MPPVGKRNKLCHDNGWERKKIKLIKDGHKCNNNCLSYGHDVTFIKANNQNTEEALNEIIEADSDSETDTSETVSDILSTPDVDLHDSFRTTGNIDRQEDNTSDDEQTEVSHNPPFTSVSCHNCHREDLDPRLGVINLVTENESVNELYYRLELEWVTVPTSSFRRKFCCLGKRENFRPTVVGSTSSDRVVRLCRLCRTTLLETDEPISIKSTWPSMFWKLLTNDQHIHRERTNIWKVVPCLWRKWWISAAKNYAPDIFGCITLTEPASFFSDVTMEKSLLEDAIEDGILSTMKERVDKLLLPLVRCPWGCCEFYHKCGAIPLDVTIARFLDVPNFCCPTTQIGLQVEKKLIGARDDYFTVPYEESLYLYNPNWCIRPSICFSNGAPVVLTCREHNKGSQQRYLHPPMHPFGVIASVTPDQIAPASVRPRTIKPVRPKKYCHTYQMHEMRGYYGGVDTFSLMKTGDFNERSTIKRCQESLTLQGRPDVRSMFIDWRNKRTVVPTTFCDATLDSANDDVPSIESMENDFLAGSTYISLADATELQSAMRDRPALTIRRSEQDRQDVVHFRPSWPIKLTFVHNWGVYGMKPFSLSRLRVKDKSHDCRLFWALLALHTTVPPIWNVSATSIITDKDWQGWLLSYAFQVCLHGKAQRTCFVLPQSGGQAAKEVVVMKHLGIMHDDDDTRGGDSTFADGCYHPEQLKLLFAGNGNILVQDEQVQREARVQCVLPEHSVIIVYQQDMRVGSTSLENTFPQEAPSLRDFELRFVFKSQPNDDKCKWTGQIYVRHGGPHTSWWWQDVNSRCFIKSTIDTSALGVLTDWSICVFVRKSDIHIDKLRETFLCSLGGQNKVCCANHGTYLVVIPTKKKNPKCCANDNGRQVCNKATSFCCSHDQCCISICKDHLQALSCNTKIRLKPRTETPEQFANGDTDIDEANSVASDITDVDIESITGDSVDLQHVPDQNEDDASVFSGLSDPLDAANLQIDPEDMNFIPETQQNEGDLLHDIDDVPGTMAGCSGPLCFYVTDQKQVGGHVVLNSCGSLLARKNGKSLSTRYQQQFLQTIVANDTSVSVPLLYPEATLFPSIFWKGSFDGSVAGAIPCCLLAQDTTLSRFGLASVRSHCRCRLTNASLLTSTNQHYISYLFDSIVNLGCRGQDTRVILHRGLSALSKDGVRVNGVDEPMFDTDSVDSRPVVNKLSAACKDIPPTYFYTHTANQSEHFGLRLLKRWIDSNELNGILMKKAKSSTQMESEEFREAVVHASAVAMLRQWMEIAEIWMHYITYSPEYPLGRVRRIWWRHEFQDLEGNLSHIHCLVTLVKEDRNNINSVLNRIRGSIMDLITVEEMEEMIEEGLVEDLSFLNMIKEQAEMVLKHLCTKRCQKRFGPGNGETKCKVTNNGLESPNPKMHVLKKVHIPHSSSAMEVLHRVGLFTLCPNTGNFIPTQESLIAIKHYPPSRACEGSISACNGRLFAATMGNQNLKFCSGYILNRYLAKYVASIDQVNKVFVGAKQETNQEARVDVEMLHNTKIATSAINEMKRLEKRRDVNHPTGRAISMMEMLCVILGYDQVYTTIEFVHIPTVPYAERPAFDRKRPIDSLISAGIVQSSDDTDRLEDLHAGDVLPAFLIRNQEKAALLPTWRQMAVSEVIICKDNLLSPLSMDNITIFSVRPPELRFVRKAGLYFRWFSRKLPGGSAPVKAATVIQQRDMYRKGVNASLEESQWIDGVGCRIFLRDKALPEILDYLKDQTNEDFYACDSIQHTRMENPHIQTARFFARLKSATDHTEGPMDGTGVTTRIARMFDNCFQDDSFLRELPVIWYNSIKPSTPHRWLIHLLLSMGEFDNELNLMTAGSILSCFKKAKLLGMEFTNVPDGQEFLPDLETAICVLTKRYITEQLVYLAGGSKQFDKLVVLSYRVLRQSLVDNCFSTDDLPSVCYTRLQRDTNKKTEQYIAEKQQTLITTTIRLLREKQIGPLPSQQSFMGNSPSEVAPFDPTTLGRVPRQNHASHTEQQTILEVLYSKIRQYHSARIPRCHAIIGGPGTGKTTLLQIGIITAAAHGLNLAATATMAERATQLGGIHIADLFQVPVNERVSPSRLAELSVGRLLRSPTRLGYLNKIDVLAIDELGQVSAQLISVLDMILRRIRSNGLFMGGLLLFCSMDVEQLYPVNGIPPLMSPHMITCFDFSELEHSVRASRDNNLRRIQDISRMRPHELTPSHIREFRNLIETCCTHVSDWKSPLLTHDKLRMFGKRVATGIAREKMLHDKQQEFGSQQFFTCRSTDLETTLEGNWNNASSVTSRLLDKCTNEPRELCFYPFATYEITFNKPGIHANNQLCILIHMPSKKQLDNFDPIKVMVAPEGCKNVPNCTGNMHETLTTHGWRVIQLGTAPERATNLQNGIQGKRRQYGLSHRIASTVHAGMGQDLSSLVTKVCEQSHDSTYSLWEKAQVVVLLSRTNLAKDIIFVGEPAATSLALAKLLYQNSQYADYMNHLLSRLRIGNQHRHNAVVELARHPFSPVNVSLPPDNSGYVYILVSTKDLSSTYIGQSGNLVKRLKEHNSGFGSASTKFVSLRPWAILAFVCGFSPEDGKIRREQIECQLKRFRDRKAQTHGPLHPMQVVDAAEEFLVETEGHNLRLVKCWDRHI